MTVTPFPSAPQMTRRIPLWCWHVVRVFTVAGTAGIGVLLIASPSDGLKLFWRLLIPLLPALWLIAPGIWRNACPLAASNQVPRLLGFTRGLTAPQWFVAAAPWLGMAMFMGAVASRPVLFNSSGPATAGLLFGALGGAFVGGVVLKGKSGWCSSICPLLAVQRVYGQTPMVVSPNSHCQPCVGCTKNCYDFNPRVAYLADLKEDDRHFTGARLFFVGAFPGLIIAFFTTPSGISDAEVYSRFLLAIGASAGSFFGLQALVHVSLSKLTSIYGAAAINLFYWWAGKILCGTVLDDTTSPVHWVISAVVLAASLVWLVRTWRKEKVFEEQLEGGAAATGDAPVRFGGAGALEAIARVRGADPEVTIEPAGLRVLARPGQSLLDVVEGSDQKIESGCRMGVCGADPVCVVDGMEHLSQPGSDECATLERLGYASNTRMACCAKVRGPVTVRLTPEREAAGAGARLQDFAFDEGVRRVVVIGNGIAGVTTTDHIRRRHPGCTIDLVAAEPYPLYNRMGIARLIYGRSAMVGLHLLPDAWYDDNQITMWLNTRARSIDTAGQIVHLATGEDLPYDRLVLAMGSDAFVPELPGYGLPGSFVLRRADDALEIREFAQEHGARSAVVAGGGLLGLEAAFALSKINLSVTVLERGDWLLRRQLDLRAAQLLQSYLEGLGLVIHLRAQTARLLGHERLERVELSDGRELDADVFLVAAGIAPATGLAMAAGLTVERGVVVDDAMRTSDPHVFAVGDVAQHRGNVLGLWPVGVEQAQVAAENVAGGERSYEGSVPVTLLKVVGIDVLSCGRFEPRDDTDELVVVEDPDARRYAKLLIRDGVLEGAVLLGHGSLGAAVSAAVRERRDVSAELPALRAGQLGVLAPEESVA